MMTQPKTVVGLGNAGCAIATALGDKGWRSFSLDSGLKNSTSSQDIGTRPDPEAWEENIPNVSRLAKKIGKGKEILFVVAGSGSVSSATAVILEQFRHCKISVLYIRPADLRLLSEQGQQLERLIFQVLQQYARSAVLERLYLVDNAKIEEILGGVSPIGYNDKLNEVIVSTLDLLISLEGLKPVAGNLKHPPAGTKLTTFGLLNTETREEKPFFKLDFVSDIVYYYAMNEEKLKTDTQLLAGIRQHVHKRMHEANARTSFRLYATEYDHDYGYVVHHTSLIQEETLA